MIVREDDMTMLGQLLLIAILAIPPADAWGGETLSGEALRTLVFGNTLDGRHDKAGAAWSAFVDADGRIHIKGTRPEGAYEFFGQVTIEDDRWCEQWKIENYDQKKCRQIAREGERFDVLGEDGGVLSSFTLRPGDPEGLGQGTVAAAPAATPAIQAATPEAAAIVLTNESIIALRREGFDDAAIVAFIDESPTDFDLSVAALERLREAGIGPTIVSAMLAAKVGR
jgi:hypothetical protein